MCTTITVSKAPSSAFGCTVFGSTCRGLPSASEDCSALRAASLSRAKPDLAEVNVGVRPDSDTEALTAGTLTDFAARSTSCCSLVGDGFVSAIFTVGWLCPPKTRCQVRETQDPSWLDDSALSTAAAALSRTPSSRSEVE